MIYTCTCGHVCARVHTHRDTHAHQYVFVLSLGTKAHKKEDTRQNFVSGLRGEDQTGSMALVTRATPGHPEHSWAEAQVPHLC